MRSAAIGRMLDDSCHGSTHSIISSKADNRVLCSDAISSRFPHSPLYSVDDKLEEHRKSISESESELPLETDETAGLPSSGKDGKMSNREMETMYVWMYVIDGSGMSEDRKKKMRQQRQLLTNWIPLYKASPTVCIYRRCHAGKSQHGLDKQWLKRSGCNSGMKRCTYIHILHL